jgi:hypothetical protein
MKRLGQYGLFSCGALVPIASVAFIFAAAIGGASFGVATQFNLNLVEGLVCPEGSDIVYREGPQETYYESPSPSNPTGGETSGRSFFVLCAADDQIVASGNGLLLRTLGSVLAVYFLACFLPLFIALSALFLVLQRTLFAAKEE